MNGYLGRFLRRAVIVALWLVVSQTLFIADCALAAAPNFAGKTITLIVPYDAGGTTDFEARAFARFLPDYLPGKPTVIVQNMPGGGGLVGFNYTGDVAAPDGLTLIIWTWNPPAYLIRDPGLKAPMDKFRAVGGLQFGEVAFMRKDPAQGLNVATDIVKAKQVWFGGLGPSNFKDIMGRMQLDLLGVPYHYINAYQGAQDLVLAFQRNEIQFTTISEATWITQVKPNLVDKGLAFPVYQVGVPGPHGTVRDRDLPDLPTFDETYKAIFGRAPSGKEWRLYSYLVPLRSGVQDVVWLPPGTADGIVDVYRKAFDQIAHDSRFVDQYTKVVLAKPLWIKGDKAQKYLDALGDADPATVKQLNDFVNIVSNR